MDFKINGKLPKLNDEQLERINSAISQQSLDPFNDYTSRLSDKAAEISEAIESGQDALINKQAEAYAAAYAKALRRSPFLFDHIVGALSALCGNRTYNTSSDEDTMNDFIRDILGQALQVRDQTRQGISGSKVDKGKPGELDIQIRHNGRPIGIYEGLRLDGAKAKPIHDHIQKATINYNPQGVKEVFIVAYVQGKTTGFGDFWKSFVKKVKEYNAPDPEYEITWDDEEEDTGLSAVRSIHGIYYSDDAEHNVHVMAVKILK